MKLRVYNSEKFDRSRLWYVVFGLICSAILVASIYVNNRIGALLIFFLLGGYFYYSVNNSRSTDMEMVAGGVRIGKRIFPWSGLLGFVLELDTEKDIIKNIVLVGSKEYNIYTIHDKDENLKEFVQELSQKIQMLDGYNQNFWERVLRKFKV